MTTSVPHLPVTTPNDYKAAPQGPADPDRRISTCPPPRVAFSVVIAVLVSLANVANADVATCVNDTGYALERSGGALVGLAGGNFSPLTAAFCAPPHTESKMSFSGDGSSSAVSYLAGTGMSIQTGAVAAPESSTAGSSGFLLAELFMQFMIVPDDPTNMLPASLRVHTQYEFGNVKFSSSGGGSGENQFESGSQITAGSPYAAQQDQWAGVGTAPVMDTTFVLTHDTPGLPLNTALFFRTTVRQKSAALPGLSALGGSASAEMLTLLSFLLEAPAGYSLAFEMEAALGLAPPALGVIAPIPLPAALWLFASAFCVLFIGARQRRVGAI